jgi:hypothetical protein
MFWIPPIPPIPPIPTSSTNAPSSYASVHTVTVVNSGGNDDNSVGTSYTKVETNVNGQVTTHTYDNSKSPIDIEVATSSQDGRASASVYTHVVAHSSSSINWGSQGSTTEQTGSTTPWHGHHFASSTSATTSSSSWSSTNTTVGTSTYTTHSPPGRSLPARILSKISSLLGNIFSFWR